MRQKKLINALAGAGIIGLVSLLAACGGGGGGSATTGTASGTTAPAAGTVNMAMTDGPSDIFNHVWVTVTAVSFHTDANAAWSPGDATWQTTKLTTPITIDLASLNNGAMNNVFASMNLPVGTYKQIRFFFDSDTDPLQSSAQAIQDNESSPQALQWNDQVEYTNSSGVVAEAPLEITDLVQGLQLLGTFNVTASSTLNLVTDFNLERIIVPYYQNVNPAYGTSYQGFTMKSNLSYFNLANSGGITGYAGNTSSANAICEPTIASPCSGAPFHLIVHAEAVSADGTRYEAVRSTTVDPVTGQFTVAPLALTDSNGNPLTYDVVVRGRQMQTLLVTGVTPTGTYSGTTLSGAAIISTQASPLPTTYSAEYTAQLSTPLAPLTNGNIVFEQTPCTSGSSSCTTSGLPHEIRWADTNPFTGEIKNGDRLGLAPWAQSYHLATAGLMTAAYVMPSASGAAPTTPLSFSALSNTEGAGNYSVIADEKAYYNFSLVNPLTWTSPAASELVTLSSLPTILSTVQNGTVTGMITVSTAGKYVSGELVVARFGQVITTLDITPDLATASGYGYTVTGLGAGSSSDEIGGAYYYAYVRLFNSAGKRTVVAVPGFIDMRLTNTVGTMNVSI